MNTLFTGKPLIELDETTSTNSHAMRLLKERNIPEGTLVWAQFQTEGRGQPGTKWLSEKGENLTFSLVVHPVFLQADKQFYLSKITALAVLATLTELLPASQYDIKIKWPNDILVNNKKISGVLIESLLRGNFLQSSVIGIGINVNQEEFRPENGVDRKAISLIKLTRNRSDLKEILSVFCRHFEAQYLGLKQGRFFLADRLYLGSLYGYGTFNSYTDEVTAYTGKIVGVEENGKLVIEMEDGKLRKYAFKEVVQA